MVKADGSREWRRFAKDAGEIAQLAQILGQLEELKGTLILHANEDGAPVEAIAQLHALVEQAQGILQTLVAGEDAATSEAPAAPAKRAVAEFDKDAGAVLDKRLDRLDAMLADLLKRVKNIEAQPLPCRFPARREPSRRARSAMRDWRICSPIPTPCRFSPSSSRSATAAAF